MPQLINNWGPAVIVILGYIIGYYFQNKRLDDFKDSIKARFDDMHKLIDAKFETVNTRLKAIEDRLAERERLIK